MPYLLQRDHQPTLTTAALPWKPSTAFATYIDLSLIRTPSNSAMLSCMRLPTVQSTFTDLSLLCLEPPWLCQVHNLEFHGLAQHISDLTQWIPYRCHQPICTAQLPVNTDLVPPCAMALVCLKCRFPISKPLCSRITARCSHVHTARHTLLHLLFPNLTILTPAMCISLLTFSYFPNELVAFFHLWNIKDSLINNGFLISVDESMGTPDDGFNIWQLLQERRKQQKKQINKHNNGKRVKLIRTHLKWYPGF